MILPPYIQTVFTLIEQASGHVFVVGGACRDVLLGMNPTDYDLATDRTPTELKHIFKSYKILTMGEKFGTLTIIIEGHPVEITTFRNDHLSLDQRHPSEVTFTTRIDDDLQRRDFTFNAIAYHPRTGFYDPQQGKKDLLQRKLVFVGEPGVRLTEDALRALRALRFMSRFGLMASEETVDAIRTALPDALRLPKERILPELKGMVTGPYWVMIYPLFAQSLDEMFPHNLAIDYDKLRRLPPHFIARVALMLHDVSYDQQNQWALRWRLSKHESRMLAQCHHLVNHMIPNDRSSLHLALIDIPQELHHIALHYWYADAVWTEAAAWLDELYANKLPFSLKDIKVPDCLYAKYHIDGMNRQKLQKIIFQTTVALQRCLSEDELTELAANFNTQPIK